MATNITTEELLGIAKMARVEISWDVLSGVGIEHLDETDRFVSMCRRRIAMGITVPNRVVRKWGMLMEAHDGYHLEVM